jgi:RND family efflux transporter MFP subunit
VAYPTEAAQRALNIAGSLSSRHQVTIRAKSSGEVLALPAVEGELVEQGQLLARIDPAEAKLRLSERRSALASAEAEFLVSQKQRDSQARLRDSGFISQGAFDVFEATFQAKLGVKQALIANLRLAEKALADTEIRAPFRGIVHKRHANIGEFVAAQSPLLSIVSLDSLEAVFVVPASSLGSIQVGAEVRMRILGVERNAIARIVRTSPSPESGTRSYPVYASIETSPEGLRPGMYVRGTISAAPGDGPFVPARAIHEDHGKHYVFVLSDGLIARQEVSIGWREGNDGYVQVTSGIDKGKPIVTTKHKDIVPGKRARLERQ